jgi:hypothetical protein
MTTDKSTIMRSFNANFFQFLEDIITLFPEKREIYTAKVGFETIKKTNPALLIKVWATNIYAPYREAIDRDDIEFFFDKDYSSDIKFQNNNEIMSFINSIREPVKNMDVENKKHSMDYIKLLSQLSFIYSQM